MKTKSAMCTRPCPVCLGSGILQVPGQPKRRCHHCKGSGLKPAAS